MNDYDETASLLGGINYDHLTVDQQIEYAKAQALLSISQELSQIHHEGIFPNRARGRRGGKA